MKELLLLVVSHSNGNAAGSIQARREIGPFEEAVQTELFESVLLTGKEKGVSEKTDMINVEMISNRYYYKSIKKQTQLSAIQSREGFRSEADWNTQQSRHDSKKQSN